MRKVLEQTNSLENRRAGSVFLKLNTTDIVDLMILHLAGEGCLHVIGCLAVSLGSTH